LPFIEQNRTAAIPDRQSEIHRCDVLEEVGAKKHQTEEFYYELKPEVK
jgi:hypothetical protein